jgi:hypothetical protein
MTRDSRFQDRPIFPRAVWRTISQCAHDGRQDHRRLSSPAFVPLAEVPGLLQSEAIVRTERLLAALLNLRAWPSAHCGGWSEPARRGG